MVHISQLSEARVERVEDVVRQGDEVTVRVERLIAEEELILL